MAETNGQQATPMAEVRKLESLLINPPADGTRVARAQRAIIEQMLLETKIAALEGREPVGRCTSASFITAFGPQSVDPNIARFLYLGDVADAEVTRIAQRENLQVHQPKTDDYFERLITDGNLRGGIVVLENGKHTAGLSPALQRVEGRRDYTDLLYLLDTRESLEPNVVDPENLMPLYEEATLDPETGLPFVFIFQDQFSF